MGKTTRRDFLKRAGVVSAAAILSPSAFVPASAGKRSAAAGYMADGMGLSGMPGLSSGAGSAEGKKLLLEWEDFTGVLKHTFTISGSSRSSTPIVLTRISWNGFTGYGEASMPPYLGESTASVDAFLKKVRSEVLPRFDDPFRIQEIMAETDALAANNTAAKASVDIALKASVDIALHDLTGRIMGQPWWRIWGFSPEKAPCTSFTIGYDADDSVVRAKTREASWAKVLKVKLGMGDGQDRQDRRMIRLIREVNPSVPLYVDANQGWTDRYRALDMIAWLSEHGVVLVEQPMSKHDLDSHAWLTERSPLPVIADESCQRLTDSSPEGSIQRNQHKTDEMYRHEGGQGNDNTCQGSGNEADGRMHDGNFRGNLRRSAAFSGDGMGRSGRQCPPCQRLFFRHAAP